MNRELGSDFDLAGFEHVAFWDAEPEWVEMRLRARSRQTVRFPDLDLTFTWPATSRLPEWSWSTGSRTRTISSR